MAYSVESVIGTSQDIHTKLQNLLNNATITTLHTAKIIRLYGSNHLLAYIVYE